MVARSAFGAGLIACLLVTATAGGAHAGDVQFAIRSRLTGGYVYGLLTSLEDGGFGAVEVDLRLRELGFLRLVSRITERRSEDVVGVTLGIQLPLFDLDALDIRLGWRHRSRSFTRVGENVLMLTSRLQADAFVFEGGVMLGLFTGFPERPPHIAVLYDIQCRLQLVEATPVGYTLAFGVSDLDRMVVDTHNTPRLYLEQTLGFGDYGNVVLYASINLANAIGRTMDWHQVLVYLAYEIEWRAGGRTR